MLSIHALPCRGGEQQVGEGCAKDRVAGPLLRPSGEDNTRLVLRGLIDLSTVLVTSFEHGRKLRVAVWCNGGARRSNARSCDGLEVEP